MIYKCHLENHVKYGEKIHLPTGDDKYPHYIHFNHDYVDHHHHVFTTYKDIEGMPYGWTLEAAPLWDLDCHGSDGKVPDSAVMTTRAGSILVMDYS
jgi:hypothetical protein